MGPMDKSHFDELMNRYVEGKTSEQERIKIEAWLDVMKTRSTTDLELSKEDEEKIFRKITSKIDNLDEITSFIPGSNKKNLGRWAMQIAAAVLIIVSASYVIWTLNAEDSNQLNITSKNGVEKIILNDGTLVWLHAGSRLTYFEKKQSGTRNTELQGEALFEVAKDASHPFIIKCGDVNLKVLGTSFSVKASNDRIELIVLTGKVNLSSSTKNINVDVEANEKILVTNNVVEELQLQPTEVSEITSDTEYNMQFVNVSMEEVARKIGKKFNIEVKIINAQANKCRITADFTDHSLDRTLQLIMEILDVEYSQKGKEVTITGKGCN
jgi:transmembrane sensor